MPIYDYLELNLLFLLLWNTLHVLVVVEQGRAQEGGALFWRLRFFLSTDTFSMQPSFLPRAVPYDDIH